MDKTNTTLSELIMKEVGLETDNNGNVVDQDTGSKLQFNKKNLKYRPSGSVPIHKNEIEFDPHKNTKMATQIFSYYTGKLQTEDPELYIGLISNIEDSEIKGHLELQIKRDGKQEVIKSGSFGSDCVKYADLMMKLGGSDVDLSQFDYYRRRRMK